MAELGSKVAAGLRRPSWPRSASPVCTEGRVSACGCGHARGKWEAGAKHTGQELTSHLPIQAAERASCCHRGRLSARIRQPAVIAAHPRVTNQQFHLPPASKRSRASSVAGRGAFGKCNPVSPHSEGRGFTLQCVHVGARLRPRAHTSTGCPNVRALGRAPTGAHSADPGMLTAMCTGHGGPLCKCGHTPTPSKCTGGELSRVHSHVYTQHAHTFHRCVCLHACAHVSADALPFPCVSVHSHTFVTHPCSYPACIGLPSGVLLPMIP